MQTVFAWLLTGLMLAAPYPWAAWLLTKSPAPISSGWLPVLLTLALSTGGLALLMFWQSLMGIAFSVWGITLPYLALMLIGGLLWLRAGKPRTSFSWPVSRPEWFALAIIILISAAILFNAIYWPFSRDDTRAIYHFYGVAMAQTGAIVPLPGEQTLYEAYPILVPLNYTFTYLASGWTNEYLARLIPALLSLGCIPAAYVLGKLLHSRAAGWLSAVLIVIMPAFGTWASTGYVDLPMAFFYTLAAIFAWRLWQHNMLTDALLAGALIGLATFTKNAALIGVMLFAAWLAWGWLNKHISLRAIVLALAACALIGAPWYIRNLTQAGFIIPATAWTDQAESSLRTLLVFVTRANVYGLPGLAILISIMGGVIHLFRQRLNAPAYALLLGWTLPFFIAWWLFVSYDPRFVLLFAPLLCVLAGVWLTGAWAFVPAVWQRRLMIPLAALVLILALEATWYSVEYKDNILRNPLMDDTTKHEIVLRED